MAELVEHPAANPDGGLARDWRRTFALSAIRPRLAVRSWTAVSQFMLALSVLYIAKQVIFVLIFPAFSGHDEVSHYAQLQIIATEHRLPTVPDLDEWRAQFAANRDSTTEDRIPDELYRYCRYVTDDWWKPGCSDPNSSYLQNPPRAITFDGQFYPSGWIYTANHPPLYYFVLTPLYWLTEGASPQTQLYLFRAASIPFGLLTVLLAFLTVRVLFPGDGFLAVVVPTFVAFQTQVSYEAAMLNNDILSIATYSVALYLIVVGVRDRFPRRICLALGVALGLALLAKGTGITAVGLAGLAVLLRVGIRDIRGLVVRGLQVGIPVVALAAPWYAYLYRTYGNFSAFSQIKALQYWNYSSQNPPGFFDMLFNKDFAELRFNETWGEFGWRLIPLGTAMLWIIGVPLLVCVVGLGVYFWTIMRGNGGALDDRVERPVGWQKTTLLLLVVACIAAYLAIIQFGTEFSLTQARYYFPVVNAVAILLALGLRTLIPSRYQPYGQSLVLAAMVVLNVAIITQYVIPYWQLTATT